MSSGSRAHALHLVLLLEQLLDRERDVALHEARCRTTNSEAADQRRERCDDRERGALAVRVGEGAGDEPAEEPAHQEDEHGHERERLRPHPVRRHRADDGPDADERGARARVGEAERSR